MRIPKATRQKIVALLATGSTQRDAAKVVGISEVTLSAWMRKDLVFQQEVEGAVAQENEWLRTRLRGTMQQAFDTLVAVMLNSRNDNARVRAAISVLTAGGHLHEAPEQPPGDVVVQLGTGNPVAPAVPTVPPLEPIQPGVPMPMPDPDGKGKVPTPMKQDGGR